MFIMHWSSDALWTVSKEDSNHFWNTNERTWKRNRESDVQYVSHLLCCTRESRVIHIASYVPQCIVFSHFIRMKNYKIIEQSAAHYLLFDDILRADFVMQGSPMDVCQNKAITATNTVHFLAVFVFLDSTVQFIFIHSLKSTLNRM